MAKPNQKEKQNPNQPLVMKFGGTSVGSARAIAQAVEIIAAQYQTDKPLVVIVSAMSGITNQLLACARLAVQGDQSGYQQAIANLHNRHAEVINQLFTDQDPCDVLERELQKWVEKLTSYCASISTMREVTSRGLDAISSLGERFNARLISALLEKNGFPSQPIDADQIIITDDNYQNAKPLRAPTCKQIDAILKPLLRKQVLPVVTGFIGGTQSGITTTLGRGGSDYSAAIIGDCLDAAAVWTWTDVDGVMTADPNIVPDARVIESLTFDEVSEMAYFGAKVLHPKTMRPLINRDIPLWVKNTFNPSRAGTCITNNSKKNIGKVTCVTAIRDVSLITVHGKGMLGVPGVAARTFAAVARENASVLMISQSSSEQSICFVIPSNDEHGVVRSLKKELGFELSRGDIDAVKTLSNVVIVSAIGAGMRNTPGVSAKIFTALGRDHINVIAIAQGSSEYSISLVVAQQDSSAAVQQIHTEVIINGNK